jgi:hypothetical protein
MAREKVVRRWTQRLSRGKPPGAKYKQEAPSAVG